MLVSGTTLAFALIPDEEEGAWDEEDASYTGLGPGLDAEELGLGTTAPRPGLGTDATGPGLWLNAAVPGPGLAIRLRLAAGPMASQAADSKVARGGGRRTSRRSITPGKCTITVSREGAEGLRREGLRREVWGGRGGWRPWPRPLQLCNSAATRSWDVEIRCVCNNCDCDCDCDVMSVPSLQPLLLLLLDDVVDDDDDDDDDDDVDDDAAAVVPCSASPA